MATRRLSALIFALALGACASDKEVIPEPELTITEPGPGLDVPVPTRREPPAELLEPFRPEALPEFLPPQDARVTSGVTKEGERALMLLIHDLRSALEAWRAWATSP